MIKSLSKYKDQVTLQFMALSGIVYIIVFCFIPMYGLIIAFKNYDFVIGILKSPWIGLKHFIELFNDNDISMVVKNTIILNFMKLLICFPITIAFAILLDELPSRRFATFVQTVSYFPHFISWVVISLVIQYWFSPEYGMINVLMQSIGLIKKPLTILTDPESFYWLATISETWKETGWSAIIFLAAISGINPNIYEAAMVDGASRYQKIRYITIPSITNAIIIVFILNFANLLNGIGGSFDQSFFLGNAMNYEKSIILSTYVLKIGVGLGRFSYAAAVGLLNSVVSMCILLVCNFISRKLLDRSLYEVVEVQ